MFGRESKPSGTMVMVRLNERAQPLDRGERYEDPLQELLAQNGWGEVSGGGSQLTELGEIEYCELELILSQVTPEILRAIADKLESRDRSLHVRPISRRHADGLAAVP